MDALVDDEDVRRYQDPNKRGWHVVGVPQEEIVATAMFVMDRSVDLQASGGELQFERTIHKTEARYVEAKVGHCEHRAVLRDELFRYCMIPLGQVATLKDRLIVFPNCHVHRITPLKKSQRIPGEPNNDGNDDKRASKRPKLLGENDNDGKTTDKNTRLRVLYFHLVNPEKRVLSTREVPVDSGRTTEAWTVERGERLQSSLRSNRQEIELFDWNQRELEVYYS